MTKLGPPFRFTAEETVLRRRAAKQRHYLRHREQILQAHADRAHRDPANRHAIEVRSRIKYQERYLVRTSRANARVKGLAHTITESDIQIPLVCPALQVPFEYGTPYAVSVDRIDSTIGYIPGNIQILSKKANMMKNNATAEQLRLFARWILN